MRRVRVTIVVVEKQSVLHNLCVCVCARACVRATLVSQRAMRMRRIVIRSLSCSTAFFHLTHKWRDSRKKKVIEQKNLCFDILYKFCLKYSQSTEK